MHATSAVTTPPYEELSTSLRGALIVPGDPAYDQARAVYNAMIDKRPGAIARCRDVADVMTCVDFGREHGIEIAIRGGGHNAGGLGIWDGALVIDLSQLRSTTVDPVARTVRVDAGCTWGDVDHATVAFGMATPSGFISSTGVAGRRSAAGSGISRGGSASPSTRSFPPTSCSPTAASSRSARLRIPISSGRCGVGEGTSAW